MNKKRRAVLFLLLAFSIGLVLYGLSGQATQENNKLYVSSAGDDKNVGSKKNL